MPHYNISFFGDNPESINELVNAINNIQNYSIEKIAGNTYRIICPYTIDEVINNIESYHTSPIEFIICYTYCSTVHYLNGQMNHYEKSD